MKQIKNLVGVKVLSKEAQRNIKGGFPGGGCGSGVVPGCPCPGGGFVPCDYEGDRFPRFCLEAQPFCGGF